MLEVRTNEEKQALFRLAVTVGSLSNTILTGIERGSLITLMLVFQALVGDDAPPSTFIAVRKMFENMPCDSPELETLYGSFLRMCDLALAFDEDAAHILGHELLHLARKDKVAN